MTVISLKGRLHDSAALKVLAHSHYMPTAEKMRLLADKYENDPCVSAFACADGEAILGVIVVKLLTPGSLEIRGIAVEPEHRHKGIGSKLILAAAERLCCSHVLAETDDDAVGFYRRCGFEIESMGEKYPGIVRYRCTLDLHSRRIG